MDNARPSRKVALWAAGVAVMAGALIAALMTLGGDSSEPVEPSPSPTEASDGCNGVEGQSIDLDAQIVDAPPRSCFVLDEPASLTIGAAALEPTDGIELAVYDEHGTELASAASMPDWDPQVALDLAPGAYVIEVEGVDTDQTPPFLLYTARFVPQQGGNADAGDGIDTASVPPAEACGADVPVLADDAPVSVTPDSGGAPATLDPSAPGVVHYACVVVEEAVFAKVGLASADPSDVDAPDLTMAVYRAGADGADATLVRAVDDAIGFDPETSLDLDPGVYMIAASAWLGGTTGQVEF
ncbi:MAG: hypothetical protein ACK4MD_09710, partial [Demequina sp.]